MANNSMEDKVDFIRRHLDSTHDSETAEDIQLDIGKKSRSRRRKGYSKPRRIEQKESVLALQASASNLSGKSLDSVGGLLLKDKTEELLETKSLSENAEDMIDMHDTLALHHHRSPKNSTSSDSPQRSVESPGSLYLSEKMDELASNKVNASESFTPMHRSNSDDHSHQQVLYDVSNSIRRISSSDQRPRKESLSPLRSSPKDSRSQEVPELIHCSNPNLSPTSPNQATSIPYLYSSAYSGNPTSVIAAMAAGMGLPTLIPTSAIMTSSVSPLMAMQQSHYSRDTEKKSDNRKGFSYGDTGFKHGRGIIGSSGFIARRSSGSPTPEERAQYKRPPHTYPALIASAILDSPGNLVTLRGIYEYIMNNFPYYKYGHDKSAWQNSIRHNLSLNQCFVKVPRYENAAKSNYWTMTREGFEEFGNENSFKRRRRRGATLTPISAYKTKKSQADGSKAGGKNRSDGKGRNSNGAAPAMATLSDDYASLAPQLMGLAAARGWASNFRAEDNQVNGRKRSLSPLEIESAKQQKMMELKAGDGPSLRSGSLEDCNRPNSLSSAEEMQGALNSFNKNLLDSAAKMIGKKDQAFPGVLSSWTPTSMISASQMLLPTIMATEQETVQERIGNMTSDELNKDGCSPVQMDGIEIGSELPVRTDTPDASLRHFRCRFCSYSYASTSAVTLEQHVLTRHNLEVANAKAKAVVAAVAASKEQKEKTNDTGASRKYMSIQSLMSGLSSASLMAAAQSNASSLLAATQSSAGNPVAGFPYSGNFSSEFLNDSIMRSMSEQTGTTLSMSSDRGLSSVDAYALQRQQVLNNALQQAAAAASASPSQLSQEQLRLFYQQVAMNNPFLAGSSLFQRQMPTSESDQSNHLKQQIWQQYQQKLLSQMQSQSEAPETSFATSGSQSKEDAVSVSVNASSPSLATFNEVDADTRKISHGWKRCGKCSFTAKGDHGLELHCRKVHAESLNDSTNGTDVFSIGKEQLGEAKLEQPCEAPSAFPTPPLSDSPSFNKRQLSALDLRGSECRTTSASTQTSAAPQLAADSGANRTCEHCDIRFGDDMMHALHMSCHDRDEPFRCKVCGLSCNERYFFNVHLLRGVHHQEAGFDSAPASRCPSNGSASSFQEKQCSDVSDVATCQ